MDSLIIVKELGEKIIGLGGRVYFVGGYVRDKIRGIKNPDIDIEVHGIDSKTLEKILNDFGDVIITGKNFGIYKLKKYDIDIALPRLENSIGKGHRDFLVKINPNMGTYDAAKRRDFTINSIMQDVVTEEIIDNFNGVSDLKKGIIRHIDDEKFQEDPLRVFRACQFASRFQFEISKETLELCKNIDVENLSKERIFNELKKVLLNSEKPSIFFKYLDLMGHLDYWFHELKNLQIVEQSKIYHKEGNAYIHTLMVLDEATKRLNLINHKIEFMLSALCHDFGKYETTTINEEGKIQSINHEIVGVEITKRFLIRITNNKSIIKYVLNMVENHMKPNMYVRDKSKISATNRMFDNSVDPIGLIYLSQADFYGSIKENSKDPDLKFLLERYEKYLQYMSKDYVTGKDLIKLGLNPDENFSKILKFAHKMRLSGVEKNMALKQALKYSEELIKGKK